MPSAVKEEALISEMQQVQNCQNRKLITKYISRLFHIFTIRPSFLDVCHEFEILVSIDPVNHVALLMLIVDNCHVII